MIGRAQPELTPSKRQKTDRERSVLWLLLLAWLSSSGLLVLYLDSFSPGMSEPRLTSCWLITWSVSSACRTWAVWIWPCVAFDVSLGLSWSWTAEHCVESYVLKNSLKDFWVMLLPVKKPMVIDYHIHIQWIVFAKLFQTHFHSIWSIQSVMYALV